MTRTAYRHSEAFCLMKYECDTCGRGEFLWNSRDGVTPFIINCSWEGAPNRCAGQMNHINWQQDRREPAFGSKLTPRTEMRIFVDAADQRAHRKVAAAARRYVDRWWNESSNHGSKTMRQTLRKSSGAQMTKGEAVDYFLQQWTAPGVPAIITAREYFEQVVAN